MDWYWWLLIITVWASIEYLACGFLCVGRGPHN
jgi:hypothetical protein